MFEKEIKILNISVPDTEKILRDIGSKFIFKTKQKIYTYDLPSIAHRYSEYIDFLNSDINPLVAYSYKQRLKTLLTEVADLLPDSELMPVMKQYNVESLPDIVDKVQDFTEFADFPICSRIKSLRINPNKWVRLRDTNGHVTLTVKHVFDKNSEDVQKVGEYEIEVNSVEEADTLLTALGFAKRNVQEKIRTQYKYKNAEIDLDEWPMLQPYMEIESDDKSIYQEIIDKCGYNGKEIVSCNTEELYRRIGINSRELPELLFGSKR